MLGDFEIKVYRPKKAAFFFRMVYPLILLAILTGYVYRQMGFSKELELFWYGTGFTLVLYSFVFIPYNFFTRISYLTLSEKHLFVKKGLKLATDQWDKHLLSEVTSFEFILTSWNKVLVLQSGGSKVKIYLNWLIDPKNIVSLLYYNYAPIIKNSRPEIKEFMDAL